MMLFSEDFLENLKDDPIAGLIDLINITLTHVENDLQEWSQKEYDVLIEAYALILELFSTGLLSAGFINMELNGEVSNDCMVMYNYINRLKDIYSSELNKLKLESLRSRFKNSLNSGFCYEFSQGDLEKVQTLINQIRDLLSENKSLEQDHRQRLLKRLENLQSEMHKKMSDLDKFWGLIGDAGVVLGKFGVDGKPIVDRIKDIAEIVWQTQARAEELPSGTKSPMLEHNPHI